MEISTALWSMSLGKDFATFLFSESKKGDACVVCIVTLCIAETRLFSPGEVSASETRVRGFGTPVVTTDKPLPAVLGQFHISFVTN